MVDISIHIQKIGLREVWKRLYQLCCGEQTGLVKPNLLLVNLDQIPEIYTAVQRAKITQKVWDPLLKAFFGRNKIFRLKTRNSCGNNNLKRGWSSLMKKKRSRFDLLYIHSFSFPSYQGFVQKQPVRSSVVCAEQK